MESIRVAVALCIFLMVSYAEPGIASYHAARASPAGSSGRSVSIIVDLDYLTAKRASDGTDAWNAHSAIHIDGTDVDGPLHVELVRTVNGPVVLRAFDWNRTNTGQSVSTNGPPGRLRRILPIGQVNFTNAELVAPLDGRGMVLDAYAQQPGYDASTNNCNNFIERLAGRLDLDPGVAFRHIVTQASQWNAGSNRTQTMLPLHVEVVSEWNWVGGDRLSIFDTTDPQHPRPVSINQTTYDLYVSDCHHDEPGVPEGNLPRVPWTEDQAVCPIAVPSRPHMAHAAFLPKIICAHRVNQTFTELSVVDEQAAIAAELSPETLAPSFVILDYTAGQAVGGAYGSFALQVVHNGVTAPGRAVAWQAANASASVAVLPLAAADTTYQAGLTDARRMIQHVMFGNPDSTGNERCRAGINGQPGRPDCVVLYGPGVLARSFGWELFDAVVFLLAFNDGFPMSIPDMASAFYVASSGTDDTTTSKHAAVISCRPVEPCSDVTKCTAPAVAHQCDFPRFSVQRELINVPDLNQTAAQVWARLNASQDRTCTVLADVAGRQYPSYNVTLVGGPVTIQCGVPPATVAITTILTLGRHPSVPYNADGSRESALPDGTEGPGGQPFRA